jgi:hypothetical protein
MNLEEYGEGVRVRGEEGKGLKVGERCKGKGWEKGYGWEIYLIYLSLTTYIS